jgi:hypothetical protein
VESRSGDEAARQESEIALAQIVSKAETALTA